MHGDNDSAISSEAPRTRYQLHDMIILFISHEHYLYLLFFFFQAFRATSEL